VSSAPTPVPHTPVNFVKAGGSAFFSAKCIALLTELGYEMGEFGTYSSVREYIEECRARRGFKKPSSMSQERYDQLKKEGPRSQREFQLGEHSWGGNNPNSFISGHTTFNATQVARGSRSGVRGQGATPGAPLQGGDSPCMNLTDGHTTSNYPCVAERGGSVTNDGTDSARNAAAEYNGADANGAQVGGRYAGQETGQDAFARSEADADSRIDDNVSAKRQENTEPLTSKTSMQGNTSQAKAAGLPTTTLDGTKPEAAQAADRATGDQQVSGDTAEDCIKNFRKKAAAGMRQEYADNVSENEAAAAAAGVSSDPPPTPQERRQAEEERREAHRQLRESQQARNAEIDRVQQEQGISRAEAERRVDQTPIGQERQTRQAAYDDAATRCRGMDSACAADQGRRIAQDQGRTDARCPGGGGNVSGADRNRQDTSDEVIPV